MIASPIISYLRLGNIYLEWNEIDQAQSYLSKVKEQFITDKQRLIPPGYYHYAGLWWPEGDQLPVIDWAGATVEEVEQYWQNSLKFQLEALESRIGPKPKIEERIAELEEWCALTFPGGYPAPPKPLEYQREPQYLTMAMVLIHQGNFEQAVSLLQELHQLAQSQGRIHNQIKILVVLALAYHISCDSNKQNNEQPGLALSSLRRALSLAEPGNYILIFVEEGKLLQQLLLQILPSLKEEDLKLYTYAANLLAVFGIEQVDEIQPSGTQDNHSKESIKYQAAGLENNRHLIEPLTERELNVLRLIGNGASNQEISTELVISISTVKKHSSNIFSKLGVGNRTQALIRARELNLL